MLETVKGRHWLVVIPAIYVASRIRDWHVTGREFVPEGVSGSCRPDGSAEIIGRMACAH
jgi:hypothetical protein